MAISPDFVRKVLKGLENRRSRLSFEHVAAGVDWTAMGTHPFASRHLSKRTFQETAFGKLREVLCCA